MPTTGLCLKCYEKIQWRKEYRKYKPLKAPKKCATCRQPRISQAYHVYCKNCADGKCEKCGLQRERSVIGRDEVHQAVQKKLDEVQGQLTGVRERDRRKIVRQLKEEVMQEAEQGQNFDQEDNNGHDHDQQQDGNDQQDANHNNNVNGDDNGSVASDDSFSELYG